MRGVGSTFWLLLLAGILLGIAAFLAQETFTRVLFTIASVGNLLAAVLQFRRPRRERP